MARSYPEEAKAYWCRVLGEHPTQEQIDNELHDYWIALTEVPKVYDELTQGRLSKPNTMAEHVIGRVREIEDEYVAEAVAGATANLSQRIARLEAALVEERAKYNSLGYCSHFETPDHAEARAELEAEGLLTPREGE
jgi:hypothetical protein